MNEGGKGIQTIIKCPKCSGYLKEYYDGLWCPNRCYDSSYVIHMVLEEIERKIKCPAKKLIV